MKNSKLNIVKSTNHLKRYIGKTKEIRFEQENQIGQGEKKIKQKNKIEENLYNRFIKSASKLTQDSLSIW